MRRNGGFTLVELLVVISIIAFLSFIATTSIINVSDRMNDRALKSKKKAIEKSAVIYVQNNSNKLRDELNSNYGECNSDSSYCKCYTNNTCDYKFEMSVGDLVLKKAYVENNDNTTCKVIDPTEKAPDGCLDNEKLTIYLSVSNNVASASFNS